MKTLLTLALVGLLAFGNQAQEKKSSLYLLFEFMHVEGQHGSDYQQVEDFWSGIHKQRVADKTILGWDLWSLSPSGTQQGSQYMTVTLFSSLENMLQAINGMDVMAYAKKAYPNKSDKELSAMFEKTAKSRDLANQVLLKQIDKTTGDFTMKVGTLAALNIMKQVDNSYEKLVSEVFKPHSQEMVTKGKLGSWQMLEIILPAGSEAYGTHISVSMYNDAAQLASYLESSDEDMDMKTKLVVKEIQKTRIWKELKIATLQKMVR